jgi:hypothetical protein
MASIILAHGTCAKSERVFFFSSRYGEKFLSVFQNSIYSAQKLLCKLTGQNIAKTVFLGEEWYSEPP